MDPITTAQVVPIAIDVVKAGIVQAWHWRQRKALTEQDQQEEMDRAYELAVRVSGSVLFELYSNVERARYMAREAENKRYAYATFDFSVSDALMFRLSEILPTPRVLQEFHLALAALRRADFFQRAAGVAPLVAQPFGEETIMREDMRGHAKAAEFAKDALKKGLVNRYNGLREISEGIGRAAFSDAWEGLAATFLPKPIDSNSEPDHDVL